MAVVACTALRHAQDKQKWWVGKTTLLTTWAARTGLPVLYWVAKRDPKQALMASLAQTIWAWERGPSTALRRGSGQGSGHRLVNLAILDRDLR
jgi:hypothetical protein